MGPPSDELPEQKGDRRQRGENAAADDADRQVAFGELEQRAALACA